MAIDGIQRFSQSPVLPTKVAPKGPNFVQGDAYVSLPPDPESLMPRQVSKGLDEATLSKVRELQHGSNPNAYSEYLATNNEAFQQTYAGKIRSGDSNVVSPDKKNKEFTFDGFLKMMTAQLKHQDPMNPMSMEDSMSNMAQFSSANQMGQLSQQMEKFTSEQRSLGYLGHEVLIHPDGDTAKSVVGLVVGIQRQPKGDTMLALEDGKYYASKDVSDIRINQHSVAEIAMARKMLSQPRQAVMPVEEEADDDANTEA